MKKETRKKTRKMFRRGIDVLMAVVLVLSMLSVNVSAISASQKEDAGAAVTPVLTDEAIEGSVAKVEKDGRVAYVNADELQSVFMENSGNDGAVVTLLDDLTGAIGLIIEINCTLDLGGHTIHSYTDSVAAICVKKSEMGELATITIKGEGAVVSEASNALSIGAGKVILEGGNFTGRKEGCASINISDEKAELFITGENVTVNASANSIGLGINFAQTVSLSAGTYSGLENTIMISDNVSFTLGGLLYHTDRDRYAFYSGDQPVTGKLGEKQLDGTFTVKLCGHSDAEYGEQGTNQHQRNCSACGDHAVLDCEYADYEKVDGQNHKGVCICGREEISPHDWVYANRGGQKAKDIFLRCNACSGEELVGTVSITEDFTVPYGKTKGCILEVTADPSDLVLENMKWSCRDTGEIDSNTSTCSLPEDLAAGAYACEFTASCFGNDLNLCVNGTVTPALLTADMVALSAESAVYDGSECRPIVWVPGLTEGTDYEIAYSSLDFTNAGTVIITVTGKGNYQGTAEKTFTIEPAGLRAKGSGVADGEYGTRLSDLTISGLTAVTEWGLKEIAGTWKFTDSRIPDAGVQVPYTARFVPAANADNYKLLEAEAAVTIRKKQGILTVPQTEIRKTFGDGEFSLGCTTNGDGVISCTSDNEAVAKVSGQGNISIQGIGTAVLTVSLAEGRNYTDAPDQKVLLTVEKAPETGSGSGSTGNPGSNSGSVGNPGSSTGGTGSTGGSSGSMGSTGSTGSSTGGTGSTGGSSGSMGSTGANPGGSGNPGSSTSGGTDQPFLKDSSGRRGWDVIRGELQKAEASQQKKTIEVDMNGTAIVPGSILAQVRGKDVTLTFDLGSGMKWSVCGRNLAAESFSDMDFSVKAKAGTGEIPQDLAQSSAGGQVYLCLSLAHEGIFGFPAELSIQMEHIAGKVTTADGYTGMYANLFYYNPNLNTLEFVCAGRIGEDGAVHLTFTHASDYLLVLSSKPLDTADASQDTSGSGEEEQPEKPQEPDTDIRVQPNDVKLSKTVYTYNGKAKKPSVTVTDKDGRKISKKFYSVRYKNNRKAGKAVAVVTFRDGYCGTVTKMFTIHPAGASIKKLTAQAGGFTVQWAGKDTQADGYQIQYSTSSTWKTRRVYTAGVKKAGAWKKTVKNLQAGKKYYVRIRSYKVIKTGGKTKRIYSAWSRTGRVKTL